MTSRRKFVGQVTSAAVAVAGIAATPGIARALEQWPRAGDPALKDLAARALDAARGAGASYADIRFTVTRSQSVNAGGPGGWNVWNDDEHGAVGIRTLADGAWGFAAGNSWSADAVVQLARDAVAQAKTYARVKRRKVELGSAPPVATGSWSTPIQRDPFSLSLAEKLDTLWALGEVIPRLDLPLGVSAGGGVTLQQRRQEKTFASSDGSFTTQTLYWMDPSMHITARKGRANSRLSYHRLGARAAGWEVMTEAALARDIPAALEFVIQSLDAQPVDPDKYDIVCDGALTAAIVGRTIGMAAELDRVLGYEANASGTSYLPSPAEASAPLALGPSFLNVTADRSQPGGLATVKWDDEGLTPREYDVVKGGVVTAYHTTRELAREAGGAPSTGNAGCETAMGVPMAVCPNLTMKPAATQASFDDLVAGLERGLVVMGGDVSADRQQLNGEINPQVAYEVRNGKRTRFLRNVEVLFRAPDLWKGLHAIGGPRSQVTTGVQTWKGQPGQMHRFTVSAVPVRFKGVAVTDRSRQS